MWLNGRKQSEVSVFYYIETCDMELDDLVEAIVQKHGTLGFAGSA